MTLPQINIPKSLIKEQKEIEGSILMIVNDGKDAGIWKALVLTKEQATPIYVESNIIPNVGEGNSIKLFGDLYERKNQVADGHFVVDGNLAKFYIRNAITNSKIFQVLGSNSILKAYEKIFNASMHNIVAVTQDHQDIEPEIQWGMDIFNQSDFIDLKNKTIVVQPSRMHNKVGDTKLDKGRSSFKKLLWDNNSTGKEDFSLRYIRDGYTQKINVNEWNARFPNYAPNSDVLYHQVSKKNVFMTPLEKNIFRNTDIWGSIIFPYDLSRTPLTMWESRSGITSSLFYPKTNIPSSDINKITFAHELCHAHSKNYNQTSYDDSAILQKIEAFADAGALMVYLLNGGKEEYALVHASTRSIDFLMGGTYQTGPACYKAIEKARELKKAYPHTPVPVDIILQNADLIANEMTDVINTLLLDKVREQLVEENKWLKKNKS